MKAVISKSLLLVFALLAWQAQAQKVERDVTVVVVTGVAGTDEYGEKFTDLAESWKHLCESAGLRLIEVGAVGGDSDQAPRYRLEETIEAEIKRGVATLWVVLIGHGTFDGRETKFNLSGADFSDKDLAAWLKTYKGDLVVVNTASSSAPFIKTLSGERRVVVTATKSAHEIFYPRFGEYFVEAIGGLDAADLDNDEQVSLLEAFLYAGREVKRFFEQEARIATEHAVLNGNGDQRGVRVEEFEGGVVLRLGGGETVGQPDGERAHQIYLVPNELEALMPEAMRRRRDGLEREVKALRRKRDEMESQLYYAQLEKLLLEIARIYEQIDGAGS